MPIYTESFPQYTQVVSYLMTVFASWDRRTLLPDTMMCCKTSLCISEGETASLFSLAGRYDNLTAKPRGRLWLEARWWGRGGGGSLGIQDFRHLVFLMNQFPPSIRVYHYSHFEFVRKFAEIFAAQGAPPVSTTPVANV